MLPPSGHTGATASLSAGTLRLITVNLADSSVTQHRENTDVSFP